MMTISLFPADAQLGTVREVSRERLVRELGIDPALAQIETDALLAHVLGYSRAQILSRLREPLAPQVISDFSSALLRRLQSEPIAYITGVKEFFGIDFAVGSGALIPRPETEHLVERAVQILSTDRPHDVYDIGVGSGAIILSVMKTLQEKAAGSFGRSHFVGVDIDIEALTWTKKNSIALGLSDHVDLLRGDLMSAIRFRQDRAAVVLANCPYIDPSDTLPKDVVDYEPSCALFSDDGGLAHIKRLLIQCRDLKSAESLRILLEIGAGQADRLNSWASSNGFSIAAIIKDYAGIERVVELTPTTDVTA